MRRLALLDPIAILEGNRLFTEFKGALTENFILESLVVNLRVFPDIGNQEIQRRWILVQHANAIIPIEVKSDENVKSRSLNVYRQKYNPEISVRYSFGAIFK